MKFWSVNCLIYKGNCFSERAGIEHKIVAGSSFHRGKKRWKSSPTFKFLTTRKKMNGNTGKTYFIREFTILYFILLK